MVIWYVTADAAEGVIFIVSGIALGVGLFIGLGLVIPEVAVT